MSESSGSQAVVKTYLPEAEKAAWVEHAEELDMSQSEFVRTMVQAGRRDFDVDPYPELDTESERSEGETDARDGESGGEGSESDFEARVYEFVESEPRSWEELREAMTEDLEERLEAALESLQAENRVMYSGRAGGYEAIDE
jgi:hypothetical protein